MLFDSIGFALFLPTVFFLYWFVFRGVLRRQNRLLLLASYFFYACWDWRFLYLLLFSTLLDYFAALKIQEVGNSKFKVFWFWISVIVNLSILGVFKYYNFFVDSFCIALSYLGLQITPLNLQIILPVGISFYTFHGLSYIIDCYQSKIKAERNFINYAVFVSFFPLLVAGPIERATHLLPQIKSKKKFDETKAIDGLRQILWGLFKKIVIADNCAELVNEVFSNSTHMTSSNLLLGALLFAFQIYGDFSGYSDIALGTARLFGIELIRNFAFPYFSSNMAEFWRRWHISLSSWFRDYLYIPLGGGKGVLWIRIRNIFVIFVISGLWHGANWTFIVWGILNALYITPSIVLKTNRIPIKKVERIASLPSINELFQMLITFTLTVFAWIFFRAENLNQATDYILGIFSKSFFSIPTINASKILILILFLLWIEWHGRSQKYAIEKLGLKWKRPFRFFLYYLIILLIVVFGGKEQQFIYFQF